MGYFEWLTAQIAAHLAAALAPSFDEVKQQMADNLQTLTDTLGTIQADVQANHDTVAAAVAQLNALAGQVADLQNQLAAAQVPQAMLDQAAAIDATLKDATTQLQAVLPAPAPAPTDTPPAS